jgi:hypothetical protein
VNPRAGLDNVEKRKLLTLPGLKLRPLSRPARSQSLYRLSYPVSQCRWDNIIKSDFLQLGSENVNTTELP